MASGAEPFQYQIRLAHEKFDLVNVPTGCGKTAGVFLAWLWQRRFNPDDSVRSSTPRRLVYCLPLRSLVEQTRDNISSWLESVELLARTLKEPVESNQSGLLGKYKIPVITVMGGENILPWDLYPELDMVIIGTQDMLLSRALNRGYAMSRFRWPVEFGLLNNDCRWIFDEIQLMGNALATSSQLMAFREEMGTVIKAESVWMSATAHGEWLKTPDFHREVKTLQLDENTVAAEPALYQRVHASKKIEYSKTTAENVGKLAEEVLRKHVEGTKTLVVLNTVKKSVDLYRALKGASDSCRKPIVLLHSHFKPRDRKSHMDKLLKTEGDLIAVSTQVVEAGVDVSARTLFTEVAPISSLIQRFGRCNRYGEHALGSIFLVKVKRGSEAPYAPEQMKDSEKQLADLHGDGSAPALSKLEYKFECTNVIRRKDIAELFDTTADLFGRNTDVGRFIREDSDRLAEVFWRKIDESVKAEGIPPQQPSQGELCPAPVGDIRKLVASKHRVYQWDMLSGRWVNARREDIRPGGMYMLACSDGGYLEETGWSPESNLPVDVEETRPSEEDSFGFDGWPGGPWQTIAEHSQRTTSEVGSIIAAVGAHEFTSAVELAALWHDVGKAHPAFQAKIKKMEGMEKQLFAKAPKEHWYKIQENYPGKRVHFRHELASALAMLQNGALIGLTGDSLNLAAYLAAAHHGKVRTAIRSTPDEKVLNIMDYVACGVHQGDVLPETSLGNLTVPCTILDLSIMGLGENSWRSRTEKMLSYLGPFRLAFLEALVRAADRRASGESQ
jgi:CRISPR-associated endonuclease/helicase Cas3